MSIYSYGNAAQPLAWPTGDPEVAHSWAKIMSGDGATWTVHEYPDGEPQPGRLVAAYLNGELVIVGSLTWEALIGPDAELAQGSGPGA